MGDRPIIFSAPMVKALLAGRKTQTRRIIKPQPRQWEARVIDITRPDTDEDGKWGQTRTEWGWYGDTYQPMREIWEPIKGLHYAPGDRLWVREAFSGERRYDYDSTPPSGWATDTPVWYWADGNPAWGDWTKPKPSIHMPRWASRLTLTVTEVRVQRLQEINRADALAEGVWTKEEPLMTALVESEAETAVHPAMVFRRLWNTLHGPVAWDANPWVVAITFTAARGNIDNAR